MEGTDVDLYVNALNYGIDSSLLVCHQNVYFGWTGVIVLSFQLPRITVRSPTLLRDTSGSRQLVEYLNRRVDRNQGPATALLPWRATKFQGEMPCLRFFPSSLLPTECLPPILHTYSLTHIIRSRRGRSCQPTYTTDAPRSRDRKIPRTSKTADGKKKTALSSLAECTRTYPLDRTSELMLVAMHSSGQPSLADKTQPCLIARLVSFPLPSWYLCIRTLWLRVHTMYVISDLHLLITPYGDLPSPTVLGSCRPIYTKWLRAFIVAAEGHDTSFAHRETGFRASTEYKHCGWRLRAKEISGKDLATVATEGHAALDVGLVYPVVPTLQQTGCHHPNFLLFHTSPTASAGDPFSTINRRMAAGPSPCHAPKKKVPHVGKKGCPSWRVLVRPEAVPHAGGGRGYRRVRRYSGNMRPVTGKAKANLAQSIWIFNDPHDLEEASKDQNGGPQPVVRRGGGVFSGQSRHFNCVTLHDTSGTKCSVPCNDNTSSPPSGGQRSTVAPHWWTHNATLPNGRRFRILWHGSTDWMGASLPLVRNRMRHGRQVGLLCALAYAPKLSAKSRATGLQATPRDKMFVYDGRQPVFVG
ncbi:hypothetical protein MKZ38_002923 [Zalerion maritima]|uniref:Uncharacterized protein n=1 Tax=Zalerion maritima TaxID=339359 RepID=A0AAD5RNA8_9PEZI|nr:hypothetical protein MKZ38_002923 [Zalerion maritima]